MQLESKVLREPRYERERQFEPKCQRQRKSDPKCELCCKLHTSGKWYYLCFLSFFEMYAFIIDHTIEGKMAGCIQHSYQPSHFLNWVEC